MLRDMARIMVVANQTLGCAELDAALDEALSTQPPPEVVVVAPVTTTEGEHQWDYPPTDRYIPPPEVIAHALASARLDRQLKRLAERGVSAEGEVVDHDPLHWVERMLAEQSYEQVVVCTLPERLSHWLRMDLPSRLARATTVPVRHVEGTSGPSL
jgi:hypothetical protein